MNPRTEIKVSPETKNMKMQDAREYFHHEMRLQRARKRMKSFVLWLLYLLGFTIWGFFLYAYTHD